MTLYFIFSVQTYAVVASPDRHPLFLAPAELNVKSSFIEEFTQEFGNRDRNEYFQ